MSCILAPQFFRHLAVRFIHFFLKGNQVNHGYTRARPCRTFFVCARWLVPPANESQFLLELSYHEQAQLLCVVDALLLARRTNVRFIPPAPLVLAAE
jgi:hypothetical protein